MLSEEILLRYSVLNYKIDLYFFKHKLALEVDEKRHKDINRYKEDTRENAIKEHVDCEFIRINLDEKSFDIDIEIGKIYNYIIESTKKSLNKFSK